MSDLPQTRLKDINQTYCVVTNADKDILSDTGHLSSFQTIGTSCDPEKTGPP